MPASCGSRSCTLPGRPASRTSKHRMLPHSSAGGGAASAGCSSMPSSSRSRAAACSCCDSTARSRASAAAALCCAEIDSRSCSLAVSSTQI